MDYVTRVKQNNGGNYDIKQRDKTHLIKNATK